MQAELLHVHLSLRGFVVRPRPGASFPTAPRAVSEVESPEPPEPPDFNARTMSPSLPPGMLELMFQNLYLRFVSKVSRPSAADGWTMTWTEALDDAHAYRDAGNFVDADCTYADTLQMLLYFPTDFRTLC